MSVKAVDFKLAVYNTLAYGLQTWFRQVAEDGSLNQMLESRAGWAEEGTPQVIISAIALGMLAWNSYRASQNIHDQAVAEQQSGWKSKATSWLLHPIKSGLFMVPAICMAGSKIVTLQSLNTPGMKMAGALAALPSLSRVAFVAKRSFQGVKEAIASKTGWAKKSLALGVHLVNLAREAQSALNIGNMISQGSRFLTMHEDLINFENKTEEDFRNMAEELRKIGDMLMADNQLNDFLSTLDTSASDLSTPYFIEVAQVVAPLTANSSALQPPAI